MLILMGPSASGKTEVAKHLDKKYGLAKVVTHTTRAMRFGEQNNIDYHFVCKEDFLFMKNYNRFVETTFYNDNYYGTSKAEIADNKCVVLDPPGAKAFSELKDPSIFIVYLFSREKLREKRMYFRKDNESQIKGRLENDRITFADENVSFYTLKVDSDMYGIEDLADLIYQEYQKHLAK